MKKNEEKVFNLISFYKQTDEAILAILYNKELFEKFNYFMFFIKQYIYSLVKNTDNSLNGKIFFLIFEIIFFLGCLRA